MPLVGDTTHVHLELDIDDGRQRVGEDDCVKVLRGRVGWGGWVGGRRVGGWEEREGWVLR